MPGMRAWAAWAATVSTTAVGCGTLLGFDLDYYSVDGGGGNAAGTGGASHASGTGGAGGTGSTCSPGDKRCAEGTPQRCDEKGQWEDGTACQAETELCVAGACAQLTPSCAKLPRTCGPNRDENCCAVEAVPGGTYNRSNDPTAPAKVSDFLLDRFEVTVGRFRKFVEAYPASKPMAGAGAHPKLPDSSGWRAAWDKLLPPDAAAFRAALITCDNISMSQPCYATWTDTAAGNESLPINSVNWYEAFAFCAWDGGRLPTEAEWNFAAAGGSEQRLYPWGVNAPDKMFAIYDCVADGSPPQQCALTDILPVGSRSAGDGRFGHADLAGSMFEWNLDGYQKNYSPICTDCASCIDCKCDNCNPPGAYQVARGGSWSSQAPYLLSTTNTNTNSDTNRLYGSPTHRFDYIGLRCARNP